jgi:D-3-phosphoglycerate dehydrogenase
LNYDVVVLTEPIAEEGMRLLRNEFREVRLARSADENQLCGIVSDAEAIVTRLTKITRRVVESAKRLKVIVRHGVGVDNIDLAAATEHGVQVVYTPEGLTVSVAEFTIGAILTLLRLVREADAAARSGNWNARYSELVGRELFGTTVGVVGLGRIGFEVAKRLKAFEVKLLYFDLVRRVEPESEISVRFTPFDMLLEESDIVCLHVPQTKETHHMLGNDEFARMKLGSVLVNMSRGAVVDETALVEALSSGRLSGAAIDVFEKEPLPLNSPLCKLRNVLLSPHMSAHTKEALSRTAIDVAEVLETVLSGKRARYLANPEVLNCPGPRR